MTALPLRSPLALAPAIVLLLGVLLAPGCVPQRHFVFPAQARATAPRAAPSGGEVATPRLVLGDVFVRAPQLGAGGAAADWSVALRELERHVTEALPAESRVGTWVAHRRDADYVVDVEASITEMRALNGWFGVGLGLETAVLVGGAAAGAGVASVLGGDISLGLLGGTLASVPLAIVAALVPPSNTLFGMVEGRVAVRNALDGAQVASRHARATWRLDQNGFGDTSAIDREWGRAAVTFERRLAAGLVRVLADRPRLPAWVPPAPPPPPPPPPS